MATKKCTKSIREDNSAVDFTFVNGTVLSIELESLSEEMRLNFLLHGIISKGGDSYAGTETTEDAIDRLTGVIERIKNGEWKSVRTSDGSGRMTELLAGLMKAAGQDEEACRAVLDGMTDEEKKTLRSQPAVAAAIASIKAEKAAAKAAKAAEEAGDTPFQL